MKIEASALDIAFWLPVRSNGRDVNKGTFGHVVVVAGSNGFAGAPVMVAEAAARAGAGLVTLVVPEEIRPAVMARVSAVVVTRGLKQSDGLKFGRASIEAALDLAEKATVCAIGPGIGQSEEVTSFVRDFVARCSVSIVIDADALNVLAQEPDRGVSLIERRKAATILTPHPGEMGRLLGIETEAVQVDREGAVLLTARTFGCFVLLKGAQTLIASADGALYSNNTGNPGMATAGTGDVLTGVVAALLAQRLEPLRAAIAAPYLHGLAGDLVAVSLGGEIGMIATDLIAYLPRAIAHCHAEVKSSTTSQKEVPLKRSMA